MNLKECERIRPWPILMQPQYLPVGDKNKFAKHHDNGWKCRDLNPELPECKTLGTRQLLSSDSSSEVHRQTQRCNLASCTNSRAVPTAKPDLR